MRVNNVLLEKARRSGFLTKIEVVSRQATEQEDYQVQVEDIISRKGDGEDIQFFQKNQILNHWKESYTSWKSDAWAKVPILPVTKSQILGILSGNPSPSSGDSCFEFFDDFEDKITGYFLTDWTKDGSNPILTTADLNQGYWPAAAYDPDQGAEGPWFVLINKETQTFDGGHTSISLFTGSSANSLSEHASSPISLSTDTWCAGFIEPHSLVWDESISKWRLYYCGQPIGDGSNNWNVGLAYSTDLINWTNDVNNPFTMTDANLADPVVVRWNGKWYMSAGIYTAQTPVWYVSDDGITGWTKLGTNSGAPFGYGMFSEVAISQGIMGLSPNQYNGVSACYMAHFTNNPGVIEDVGYSGSGACAFYGTASGWEYNYRSHDDIVSTKDHTDKIGGLYYFYYCAKNASNEFQMGLATCSVITEEQLPGSLGASWTKVDSPTIELSTTQKRTGKQSLHLYDDATPSTSVKHNASGNKRIVTWFYDDSSDTTSLQILRLYADTTALAGIGVYTGTTTTHYIYQSPGYTATSVARTTGWHKLEAVANGSTWDLFIDGTEVASNVGTTTGFDNFHLQAYYGAQSHGYYDDVFISKYAPPEPLLIKRKISGKAGIIKSVCGGIES